MNTRKSVGKGSKGSCGEMSGKGKGKGKGKGRRSY